MHETRKRLRHEISQLYPPVPEILRAAAAFRGVEYVRMIGRGRQRSQVMARRLAYGALHRLRPDCSLSEIGAALGRHHSAVKGGLAKLDPQELERFLANFRE